MYEDDIAMYAHSTSLYSRTGQRKYLNQTERLRFLEATKTQKIETKLFCQLLYYTGARIAEIYNLTPEHIDIANGTVIIETLKKRRRGIYREIPIPKWLLDELGGYINILAINKEIQCLWPFSLRTASRRVKVIMRNANIAGVRSCARGLRHGFAVRAVAKVPLTLVKKWLGHARLETTEIYLNIIGNEERELAKRIW